MKFNHKLDKSEEIQNIKLKVRTFIGNAQYKKAFSYLLSEKKYYPRSYYIASMLATLDAEDAYVLPDAQRKIFFKKAANKLKFLIRFTRSCDPDLKSRNINEYYWFSEQYKKQYKFGIQRVKNGELKGHYSAGVGASNYAYQLAIKGKKSEATKWAQIAIVEWDMYFKLVSKEYHDPWYWYSLAQGINHNEKLAEKAIKISAKLSGKDIKNDPAFKKIKRMLKNIK